MSLPRTLVRSLADVLPAIVLTGLVAVAMSRAVPELDGRLVVIGAAGLIGIAAAEAVGATLRRLMPELPVLEPPARAAMPAAPSFAPPVEYTPVRTSGFEAFTLAKIGSSPEENEDAFAIDEVRMVMALSDGASSSFGASVWSRLLVDGITSASGVSPAGVDAVVADAALAWSAHHQSVEVAWWAREGLERGAFATLLAIDLRAGQDRDWRALAVGDTCVFHLRLNGNEWSLLASFPVSSSADFSSHPQLVSSVGGSPLPLEIRGVVEAGDVLIGATDAVAEWLLGSSARFRLAAEGPLDVIKESIVEARMDRTMVNDDATFVRYRAS